MKQQIVHGLDVFREKSHERPPSKSVVNLCTENDFPNARFLLLRGTLPSRRAKRVNRAACRPDLKLAPPAKPLAIRELISERATDKPVATKGKICAADVRFGKAGALRRWHTRASRGTSRQMCWSWVPGSRARHRGCAGIRRMKVAVVDKRGLARGSTMASTALVQYEIDTPLITLTRKIGKEKAVRAWRRSRLAVEALAARLGSWKLPTCASKLALPRRQRARP